MRRIRAAGRQGLLRKLPRLRLTAAAAQLHHAQNFADEHLPPGRRRATGRNSALVATVIALLLGGLPFVIPGAEATEVAADQPGAILLFPKIVVDVSRDTIVQISNASGKPVLGRCFYTAPDEDPLSGEPICTTVDFRIALTQSQPTVWVASLGRPAVSPDRPPELDPGPVPPLASGFLGELRCIAVDASEQPVSANVLIGSATIVDRSRNQLLRYAAISVIGLPGNNRDNTLELNNVEYSRCPRMLIVDHFFDGAIDPVLQLPVRTGVTLVPCSADFERSRPGTASLQFDVYNEFEQRLSASLFVRCFADLPFPSISRTAFDAAVQGTLVGQTRIRPVPDSDVRTGHGVVGLAEEFRTPGGPATVIPLHFIPGNLQSDVLVLPPLF